MLAECAHVQCKRKIALKQEIADALSKGDSDSTVLEQMGAKYGATILASPPFRGFNILLWVWPFAIALIGGAIMVVRWKKFRALPGQHG
jgi:cytochrome c-type biogenesis protein CcmH